MADLVEVIIIHSASNLHMLNAKRRRALQFWYIDTIQWYEISEINTRIDGRKIGLVARQTVNIYEPIRY